MAVKVTVFKQSSKIREKTRKIFPPVIGRRPFKSSHKEIVMSLIKCIHVLKLPTAVSVCGLVFPHLIACFLTTQ